jgi:hypothetical protein
VKKHSAVSTQQSAKAIYREGRQGKEESSFSDPFATFASVAVQFLG